MIHRRERGSDSDCYFHFCTGTTSTTTSRGSIHESPVSRTAIAATATSFCQPCYLRTRRPLHTLKGWPTRCVPLLQEPRIYVRDRSENGPHCMNAVTYYGELVERILNHVTDADMFLVQSAVTCCALFWFAIPHSC